MATNFLDKAGATYLISKIKNLLNGKVDVVAGKGLSTNDYTTAEQTKLASITEGANKYVLPTASATELGGVKVGSGLGITDGTLYATGGGEADSVAWANVTGKPTALSNFTNDLEYQTAAQVEATTKAKIEAVVGEAPEALDTLKELSDALGGDADFATTITNQLSQKMNTSDLTAITTAEIDAMFTS